MQTILQENKMQAIIFVLVFNSIVALIYLIIKVIKKDINCGIMMSIFIFICPLIGPLFLFLSWFLYEIYTKNNDTNINMEELSLNKEKVKIVLKPDITNALNKVPLEEALIVSDKKSVRNLLLEMLKEDSYGSLKSILKAVEYEDSEVSHYAATAISDSVNEFKIKEKKLRDNYNKDKRNNDLFSKYVGYLYNFLSQNILSSAEQRYYCGLFEELVVTVEKYLPYENFSELYNKLVCILLDLGDKEKAKAWVDKALIYYENELDSYKAGLRYYYVNDDKSNFLLLLNKLKESNVPLNRDTLEIIRFFSH